MGEPMDRSGRVFLGQAQKFEDAYPNIDHAVLTWEERGSEVYDLQHPSPQLRVEVLQATRFTPQQATQEVPPDVLYA